MFSANSFRVPNSQIKTVINLENLSMVTNIIDSTKGLKFVSFDERRKIFLLKYDPKIYAKKEDVLQAFWFKLETPMYIKE